MNDFLAKFKKNKSFPFIVIALIAGMLLLMLPSSEEASSDTLAPSDSAREYVEYLENKASRLIREIDGVDECNVMISVSGGYVYHYASNQRVNQNGENRDTEKEYVVLDGDTPLLTKQSMPEITGVAVVAMGVSPQTEYEIIKLLSALFDLPSNRISITK